MPPRTYLTTAPGQEPSDATGRDAREPRERYVPGLAAPREPRVASRWQPVIVTLLVVLVLATLAAVTVRVTTAAQAEDPAIGDPSAEDTPQRPEP